MRTSQEFAKRTGMPEEMVNNWFINARKRSRDPREKPAYGAKKHKNWVDKFKPDPAQAASATAVGFLPHATMAGPIAEVMLTALPGTSLAPPPPADATMLQQMHATSLPISATTIAMPAAHIPIQANVVPIPASSVPNPMVMPPPPASSDNIPVSSGPVPATSAPEVTFQAAPAADR
jgi:hypothetical protein